MHTCSVRGRLFGGEGEDGGALSVPGHLVQTPTADLLPSFALVINHGTAARRRQPIPA